MIRFKVTLKNIDTGEGMYYYVEAVGFPSAMDEAFRRLEEDHSFFGWYIVAVEIPRALSQLRAL